MFEYSPFYPSLSQNRKNLVDKIVNIIDMVFPKDYMTQNNIKVFWRNNSYTFVYAYIILKVDKTEYTLGIVGEESYCTYFFDVEKSLKHNPSNWHSILKGDYEYNVYLKESATEKDEDEFLTKFFHTLVVLRVWVNNYHKLKAKVDAIDKKMNDNLDKNYNAEIKKIKKHVSKEVDV